ncbi:MAG: carbohydrate ABC transporter permease [Caldilineaceae bacterium]|nr:carbohydrate ABC transporter permease [Caldilineaceae bacterium]
MATERIPVSTRYSDRCGGRGGPGREVAAYWLSLVLVTFGALIMVVPFAFMVITSFKTQAEIIAIPAIWLPSQLTLENFVQVWNRTELLRSLINTAYVAVVITAATVFSSSLMGFVFSKYEFRGRDVIFAISLAGMMLPFYVISIPLYLIIISLGWVNSYAALIVPSLYNSFGVFLMRQFMFSIPSELLDSARLDGCSEFRIFWSIALPLAKSAAGALSLLNLMVYWNWFFWPLIVLNSEEKFTISLTLTKFMGLYWTEYGPLTAGSFLAVIPIVVTFLVLQRYFVEGIATTGMKG